jgi:hypothetical protein
LERFYRFSRVWMPFIWQPIDKGILPALHAATSPRAESGGYYGPDGFFELTGNTKRAKISSWAADPAGQKRLWDISEQLTGVVYPKAS